MPEGDTVWQTARRLHTALAGRVLTRSDLRVPRFATADLTGRPVLDVTPRGKHLLTRIDGGLTLHSHLRMDGSWQVYAPGEHWRGGPSHQIRAILGNAEAVAVGYRLPVLALIRTADESDVVGHLGPDLLGPDWDPQEAERRLTADPARPLGEALLDQRNLAGIGNVYKSELAFLATVHRVHHLGLGVAGFGQSGSLEDVYRHHGIDTDSIIGAALDLTGTLHR